MSRFLELAKTAIQENKNVVISIDTEDKVTVAQQLVVNDNGQMQYIYLKHAINTDLNGLKGIKNAIEEAIEKIENKK